MANENGSRAYYGEAFWRAHHEAWRRSGPAAPAAIFVFAPDRKSERPAAHLENFSGILHVDGYAGFARLQARGDVTLAACANSLRVVVDFKNSKIRKRG